MKVYEWDLSEGYTTFLLIAWGNNLEEAIKKAREITSHDIDDDGGLSYNPPEKQYPVIHENACASLASHDG